MASDMFLKLADIKGDATDDKHKSEIDILAWSWGMAQSGSAHVGGGAGTGKVSIQDLHITKYVDRASPNLQKFCCTGKHLKEALLTVRKAGGHPLEYIKIKLEEVLISSVTTGGSHGEDRLTENVTLNFGKFEYEYTPQKGDGSGDASIKAGYDIPANKVT